MALRGSAQKRCLSRTTVKSAALRALSLPSSQPWRLYKSSGTAILTVAPTIPHTAPPPQGTPLVHWQCPSLSGQAGGACVLSASPPHHRSFPAVPMQRDYIYTHNTAIPAHPLTEFSPKCQHLRAAASSPAWALSLALLIPGGNITRPHCRLELRWVRKRCASVWS